MINSKQELIRYIELDKEAFLQGSKDSFVKRRGKMRQFYVALRKSEYYRNIGKSVIGKCLHQWFRFRYRRLGLQLSWDVPENVLGPGTRIMHPGTVVINGAARIGAGCKIHACVNIGASSGDKGAPCIGTHVYIGPGAKIFGNIEIADDVAIGANAVVNKSFLEQGITIAGVPAKKISDKGFDF